MILNHPTRDVKLHAALAAHEDIYDNALAGGESDQELSGTPGSSKTAPSSSKARGRPRKPQQNRRVKPLTPALGRVKPLTPALKRSSESELDLPTTSHSKCEACGQHHNLKGCYYVYPDNAPEWWKPNPTIRELIKHKIEYDPALQGLLRGQSRPRTRTPAIKLSDTPEADQSPYK
ncbi:hypothetical protein CFE70_010726 [Pyrenophora teres f. teres 0-1]